MASATTSCSAGVMPWMQTAQAHHLLHEAESEHWTPPASGNLRVGLHGFPLPVTVPEIAVSLLWHPRLDADPAHRRPGPSGA